MRPVLIELFGIPVFSYGTMIAIAFITGYLLLLRNSKELGLSAEQLADFAMLMAISGIIGARLMYVAIGWEYYAARPLQILDLREGGLSFHGGAILAIIVGVYYLRKHKRPLGRVADSAAPAFALGVALVRIGCLLNGCCYGLPTSVPWALDCSFLHDLPRHPTQIYESLAMFGAFLFLWSKRNHRHFSGYLLVLFTVIYSVVRFIIEFFRDVPIVWPPFSPAQLASAVIGLIGIVWIIVGDRVAKPSASTMESK